MEVLDLSGEDEEYLSIEREDNKEIKIIFDRLEKIENKIYYENPKLLEKHQQDIKMLYDKIMILEEKIMNPDNQGKSLTEYLDEIWEDFKNFVKLK
tara:strand:- start:149 stop:436 length:288 start_codon:yes stop_codon:yes gene_type:complete